MTIAPIYVNGNFGKNIYETENAGDSVLWICVREFVYICGDGGSPRLFRYFYRRL